MLILQGPTNLNPTNSVQHAENMSSLYQALDGFGFQQGPPQQEQNRDQLNQWPPQLEQNRDQLNQWPPQLEQNRDQLNQGNEYDRDGTQRWQR